VNLTFLSLHASYYIPWKPVGSIVEVKHYSEQNMLI